MEAQSMESLKSIMAKVVATLGLLRKTECTTYLAGTELLQIWILATPLQVI